jgi:chaperonin cofactor prefoldin
VLDPHQPHYTHFQKRIGGAMDPNSKLLLDEMKKLSERFTFLELRIDALGNCFTPLEAKADEISAWKAEVDASVADLVIKVDAIESHASKPTVVDDLKQQISTLSNKIDRVVLDRTRPSTSILPTPEMAAATPSVGNPAVDPEGHRFNNHLRENGYGSVMAYTQLPVKGTSTDPFATQSHPFGSHRFQSSSGNSMSTSSGHWPKLPFPKFEGENPKLWQSHCETYFDMCGIDK